jgi:hypothetical protein
MLEETTKTGCQAMNTERLTKQEIETARSYFIASPDDVAPAKLVVQLCDMALRSVPAEGKNAELVKLAITIIRAWLERSKVAGKDYIYCLKTTELVWLEDELRALSHQSSSTGAVAENPLAYPLLDLLGHMQVRENKDGASERNAAIWRAREAYDKWRESNASPTPSASAEEVQEWISHMDLHLTEHDIHHAGLALRAAWPHVRAYLSSVENERNTWKELAGPTPRTDELVNALANAPVIAAEKVRGEVPQLKAAIDSLYNCLLKIGNHARQLERALSRQSSSDTGAAKRPVCKRVAELECEWPNCGCYYVSPTPSASAEEMPLAVCRLCKQTWRANFRYEWPKCPQCGEPASEDHRALTGQAQGWIVWNGEYEKQHYDVRYEACKVQLHCWPNAGRMVATDGSGKEWFPGAGVAIRVSDYQGRYPEWPLPAAPAKEG